MNEFTLEVREEGAKLKFEAGGRVGNGGVRVTYWYYDYIGGKEGSSLTMWGGPEFRLLKAAVDAYAAANPEVLVNPWKQVSA